MSPLTRRSPGPSVDLRAACPTATQCPQDRGGPGRLLRTPGWSREWRKHLVLSVKACARPDDVDHRSLRCDVAGDEWWSHLKPC